MTFQFTCTLKNGEKVNIRAHSHKEAVLKAENKYKDNLISVDDPSNYWLLWPTRKSEIIGDRCWR